jgi:hemolysin activation/secretion protein
MYLGGASGVRAYPQGEGSGDEGIMATIEPRFYTKVPGLVFSTYFDIGHIMYYNDGSSYSTPEGRPASSMTLKGYGAAISYTKPNDWFARLDYARRIGGDPNLSEKAKAKGRLWFMLGKIW